MGAEVLVEGVEAVCVALIIDAPWGNAAAVAATRRREKKGPMAAGRREK